MDNVVRFLFMWNEGISLDAAHVAVKAGGRSVMGVAAAKELRDSPADAIFPDTIKGLSAQALSPIFFTDVQIVQTKRKVLVASEVVRAKGKITDTLALIQK